MATRESRRCNAFTLIEVLIVVIIISVLAAVVISQSTVSTRDAKASTLEHNLHVLRSQIELYRPNHLGRYPTIQGNGLPQLTTATNGDGEPGPSGPAYPCGPYIVVLPPNPFDNSDKVTAVAAAGTEPNGVVGGLGGWQYDETTGGIWPNHPDYFK